jgi:LDH2 family malate/lactate/ureidoglycolate dehydrogenase
MGATMPESVLVDADALRRFTARAFEAAHVPQEEARIAADVLVTADLRGVDSHGCTTTWPALPGAWSRPPHR